MSSPEALINAAFDDPEVYAQRNSSGELSDCLDRILLGMESGELRVAEPLAVGQWQVNEWLKKAVLLYFRSRGNVVINGGHTHYFDKVPSLYAVGDAARFEREGVRVVPPAMARRGCYLGPQVVLMPSYVNIGAWIGEGTMVDTWATVGSCAQIGKHVHLSGGVGIGGVLEPLQATPTIIEDHCFIGARSEVVEGVVVERGSVLSMGVYLGQSTRIYNRMTGQISRGRIPAGSVVVPGSLPAEDGTHSLYCAVIVKQVDEATRAKTAINEILRGVE